MQKKLLISIVAVNLFILSVIVLRMNYTSIYSEQLATLNQNQIRFYNETGLTETVMDAIEKSEGISQVEFDNQNLLPTYQIEGDDYGIIVTGVSLEEDNVYQQQLDYIAGSYLTKPYQVVISQSLGDVLVTVQNLSDYQQLIGSDLVTGLEIVGVYKDTPSVVTEHQSTFYDFDQESDKYIKNNNYNITNSFFLFNRGEEVSKDQVIYTYNQNVLHDYQRQEDFNTIVTNEEEDGSVSIDYEQSVENGAIGLIDPQTTDYGPNFNQYGFVETTAGNRDNVVSELQKLLPEAVIQTSDTVYSDVTDSSNSWFKIIITSVLLELLIFVPVLKKK